MAAIRHLLVYGTLRTDAPVILPERPDLSGRVRSIGMVRLAGRLHDAGGYPLLVPAPALDAADAEDTPDAAAVDGPWTVVAELLELLDADVLARIDDYEELDVVGADGPEYRRVLVHVAEHGVDAWLYCAGRDASHLPCITSGDWLRR
jgi:gamma-glutamylcyclotransferase (GGCT)/AIG2-like uncharacterized protein YtfP